MYHEFYRVMGEEGPSHVTLFRYAVGKVQQRNRLTQRYVQEAVHKIKEELGKKQLREGEERPKQGEEVRGETHSLFQAIVEGSADVMYVQDLEGKYVFINPAGLSGPSSTVSPPAASIRTVRASSRRRRWYEVTKRPCASSAARNWSWRFMTSSWLASLSTSIRPRCRSS